MKSTTKSKRAIQLERRARTSIGSLGFQMAKIGVDRFDLSDPYHIALTVHWPAFVGGVLSLYGLITSAFAGLYLLEPSSVAHAAGPSDYFFFSIETLATVGYGVMAPTTLYGHLISSAEIITGMAFTAIMTGLVFVRFSKPRAKIVFADIVVVARHNGRPTLMVRIGNGRATLLTQTTVQINALLNEDTVEGGRYRLVHDLRLTRSAFPIFPLITTFMHVIDEGSPLAAFDVADLPRSDLRLIVSIQARDPKLAAIVYDLKSYAAADLRPGMRFVDAITVHEDGLVVGDLTRISEIEPDPNFNETPVRARDGASIQIGS
jgi:inward rectifier potassium channel